jgi:hypothetical protein
MTAYLDWLPSRSAGAPPWLLRGWGGEWLRAKALVLDALVESAKQAVKVRFPSDSPPDGLAEIARERLEARATAFVYEDDFAFAERLRTAWSRREFNGSSTGLSAVFSAFGFPSFTIYDQEDWFPSKKWHAWIYLPKASHPWGPAPVVGDGTKVGDGATVGSSLRVGQVRNLREVTASWCPPHAMTFLHLQTEDGAVVGDGSDVGDGSLVGGKSCKLRLGKASLS